MAGCCLVNTRPMPVWINEALAPLLPKSCAGSKSSEATAQVSPCHAPIFKS